MNIYYPFFYLVNTIPDFVLASAFPARRKLLQMVGIEPIGLFVRRTHPNTSARGI